MDKDWKLQRYARKDYTELVDFPVEIVGRDGVVRRYSFEDSIRLYQRRITFAPIRYRDTDLVDAEVGHCRSRIDQLRRSYFHRFGWGTPIGQPEPLQVFGDLAGELAAFVCRVLRSEGRPDVVLEPLADTGDTFSTWYLMPSRAQHGMLLYVYRFDGPDADAMRERFFDSLKALERVSPDCADSERLVAFHHTIDCGFVLTARAEELPDLEALREGEPDGDGLPTAWDETLEVMRRGDFEEAAARCRDLVRSQPYHRAAYVAGAVLSVALHRYYDAEDFALIGSSYFPDDPVLRYQIGLARFRLARMDDALEPLEKALELSPGLAAARFHLANVLLELGRPVDARRVLQARDGVRADHRRGESSLRRLEQWLRWKRVMGAGAATSFALGLLALLAGGLIGLIPILMSLAMGVTGTLIFRRQLDQLRVRQRYDELAQGLRRVHRRAAVTSDLVS